MKQEFLGNIGRGRLHALKYADGRCKINSMKPENKVFFDSYEEGMAYPSPDAPAFRECGICIPKYKKERGLL